MEPKRRKPSQDSHRAEARVAALFEDAGWHVERQPSAGPLQPDLLLVKGRQRFVAAVKVASESRSDRVIPLLADAILRSRAYAHACPGHRALAILQVPAGSHQMLRQVEEYVGHYAADQAVGVVAGDGLVRFWNAKLQDLNVEPELVRGGPLRAPGRVPNMFSDLNQWLLKVLLAPEIPEPLLGAPRGRYRNVSELAAAADVSVMSAFRFAELLRSQGFLDDSAGHLQLVRRDALFDRWQSAARLQLPRELPMRLVLLGDRGKQLRAFLEHADACAALFAAADALGMGFVGGVPAYAYVRHLNPQSPGAWKGLARVQPGEMPDVILRQPAAPQSVFRGAVRAHGVPVCDVLQVWLDVSGHPSRGAEQAQFIERKVFGAVLRGEA
jgi:hypothetical protein